MGPVACAQFTASGAVTGATMIVALVVTDATSVDLKVGGASGTTILSLAAVQDASQVFTPAAPIGVHNAYLNITGSGSVSVLYA